MTVSEMREKLRTFTTTATAIIDKAAAENRSLTTAEQKDIDGLKQKADELLATIRRYDDIRDLRSSLDEVLPNHGARVNTNGVTIPAEVRPGQVRTLTPQQNLADLYPGESRGRDISIGRYIRGMALNRWDGAEAELAELRTMNEGTGAAGGFTVPTPLSARLIDLARKRTAVVRAGAITVPMESQTLSIARLAGDPTAGWRAENAAITASDMTFEKVTFTAKTLAAMCKLSVELFEDGSNIDAVVADSLAQALSLEMDRAALLGDGTGAMPTGIYSQTGVQSVAAGGALANYSKIVAALRAIYDENGEPNAMIYSPRTWESIAGFADTTGQPLRAPADVEKLAKFVTNQVPVNLGTGTNESPVFVGDFRQVMIGMRTNLVIEVSRVASDATSRAFENLMIFVRAYLRADVQLAHPKHLVKITGITPAE